MNAEEWAQGARTRFSAFEHPPGAHTLTAAAIRRFQNRIYAHYHEHGRKLPWRETSNPYHILISEIMLQQTQVERVTGKYVEFISAFPDFHALAQAPLQKILTVWHGLGYNRRALALKKIAEIVVTSYNGSLPSSPEVLQTLPGIGTYTASALAAFAFNQPTVFIETNIRTVFIHFFFQNKSGVKDSELRPLVETTLDASHPRRWYYALMDYGVMLKKQYKNTNRRSAHYHKQTPFKGSNRQLRGMILKMLTHETSMSERELVHTLKTEPSRVKDILIQLQTEGFIRKNGTNYLIA